MCGGWRRKWGRKIGKACAGWVAAVFFQNSRGRRRPTTTTSVCRASRGVTTMPAPCGTPRDALSACKRELGLHPRQCYPSSYKGQCDSAEFELKQCLAFAADPRDAKLLYDASRPREVRVAANARLQKKLKDQPCSP